MTQRSLTFDPPRICGWCLDADASTMLYATPTCLACSVAPARERVNKWLQAARPR